MYDHDKVKLKRGSLEGRGNNPGSNRALQEAFCKADDFIRFKGKGNAGGYCTARFSITFDLSWKVMKDILVQYYSIMDFIAGSPREDTVEHLKLSGSDLARL